MKCKQIKIRTELDNSSNNFAEVIIFSAEFQV